MQKLRYIVKFIICQVLQINVHNNCITSIKSALKDYDGCEFDLRLSKDKALMLYHNRTYKGRKVLETKKKNLAGLDTFEEFLKDSDIIRQVNNDHKTLWIETKEDSGIFFKSNENYCKKMAGLVTKALKRSDIDLENVRVISFCPDIPAKVHGVKILRIFPYIFSGAVAKIPGRNHRTIYNILTPLTSHIKWAKKKKFDGIMFSKLYFHDRLSWFQPAYDEIKKYHTNDFILGTGTDTRHEEEYFSEIAAITDYRGKRSKRKRKGPLICHRGLGHNPRY